MSPKWCFWLGFAFSVLCAMISGLDFSFNVYALQLKETFNLTHAQDELVASMSTIGVACGILEPFCTRLFGFKTTCLIVALGAPVTSGLYSLIAHYSHVFHFWPSVICLIQLSVSVIFNIGFFACTRVCVESLPKKHTGKLVAVYLGSCCVGKIYYGAWVEFYFRKDLCGFFLSVCIASGMTYCPCVFFLHHMVNNEARHGHILPETEESDDLDKARTAASVQEMLKSPFFHILFFTGAVFSGSGFTCLNNITTIAQSANMPNPLHTVFVMSFVILITRIFFGLFLDAFRSPWSGLFLLEVSYLTFGASMAICLFYLSSSTMFFIASLSAIGIGSGVPTPTAILLDRFGRVHYSVITSGMYTVASVCQIALQLTIGYFYDLQAVKQDATGNTCYGRDCFYWSVISVLIITSVVAILQVFNFVIFTSKTK